MFSLGQVVKTRGVDERISEQDIFSALDRYVNGDWGDVCEEDWKANDDAIKEQQRILGSYKSRTRERFWIITEWDRSVTTVLLPEEY